MNRRPSLTGVLRLGLIAFFCLLLCDAALSRPVIEKYDLAYSFNFAKGRLFCKAELSLKNVKQNDTLNLLLYRLLRIKSIKDNQGNDIPFTQHVTSFADWEALQVNSISVNVGGQRQSPATKTIVIEYDGLLLGYTETGMRYVKDNIDPAFTMLRMDCFAYPVQGEPSWEKTKAAGLSFFDYTISIKVPDTLFVANGGQLVSRDGHNGVVEFVYRNIKPAWRIDIAIGKYSTLVDNGFSVTYFPRDSIGATIVAMSAKKAISLYSTWFGDIRFSGYSIIEIPEGWGSQTDVTSIIQSASAFKDENRLFELYHELSHMWNIRSIEKNPCRLESEGLAMFLQYLVTQKINNTPGLLDSSANLTFLALKRKFASDSSACHTPITEYGVKNMTELSYTKGMLFFYLLYKSVGEDALLKTIKEYYVEYGNTGTTIDDFSRFVRAKLKSELVENLVRDWIYSNRSSHIILERDSLQHLVEYPH